MAEEEVVVPATSDCKRKLEDPAPQPTNPTLDLNVNSEPDTTGNAKEGDEDDGAPDAKRPRLEDKPDDLASENGCKPGEDDRAEKKITQEHLAVEDAQLEDSKDFSKEGFEVGNDDLPAGVKNNEQQTEGKNNEQQTEGKNNVQQTGENNEQQTGENNEQQTAGENNEQQTEGENIEQQTEGGTEYNEQPGANNDENVGAQETSSENPPDMANTDAPIDVAQKEHSFETSKHHDVFADEQLLPSSEGETLSRRMDVPNTKVGVLIGKAGDTIRYLQVNSGAKIQITKDADINPHSAMRTVELIGGLENINKAEKLIKDVIAEAEAGGSPSLIARGFATAPAVGGGEQIQIQVSNDKVGLIIGKGGETIKHMQTRSGARIQLIPQHLPEGDQSRERTVRVTGDKKQIEMARDMIIEVMKQNPRSSSGSSGHAQQTHRSRGPSSSPQWASRGSHSGYDYQHRGPHSTQNPQYLTPSYGGYPPQHLAPRGGYGLGWDQRTPAMMQGRPSLAGSAPSSQSGYNYGPDYRQPSPYSHAQPQQGYGHGYEELKYGAPVPTHHQYGGSNPQAATQQGYMSQPQYGGRLPSYSMQSQGLPPQSYPPPRVEVPYQAQYPSNQSYGQAMPVQPTYPYASSGPIQPAYGSAPVGDGYGQQVSVSASGQGYTQQPVQSVSGYVQPAGQQQLQPSGYVQGAQGGGYGSYVAPAQPAGYVEQQASGPAPSNAGYGYQGPADPSYNAAAAYGAPGSVPQGGGYVQPVPVPAQAQAAYDQAAQPPGGYPGAPGAPGAAAVGYGKSASPQPGYPQYDSSQVFGSHG